MKLQHLCCSAYLCQTPVDGQGQVCPDCQKRRDYEAARFKEKYGMEADALHELIKPVFLWMYDKGISEVHLTRHDKRCLVTVDGNAL